MTNREKYKSTEERYKAFLYFCKSHHDCTKCQFFKNKVETVKTPHNCKFSWLALESEEEKKSDEVVVTNEQKYKTPEEQAKAFLKFCNQYFRSPGGYNCIECPAAFKTKTSCDLVWLTLKAEDEKND